MKRRIFIRNTGLSIAGLAFSNRIYSKNITDKKSLEIVILLCGGIRHNDLIDIENNRIDGLFNDESTLEVNCKKNVRFEGKNLDHSEALLEAIDVFKESKKSGIFISSSNSDITKSVINSAFPFSIIETQAQNNLNAYRNDAAIFDKALQYINPDHNLTLVLNLEDTDIAHCNTQKYFEVINFYKAQINKLCQLVYSPEVRSKCNTSITVASVLGRNNFENEIYDEFNYGAIDHYDQSARALLSIQINYAPNFTVSFDNKNYQSNNMLELNQFS